MLQIRRSKESDRTAIRSIHTSAFGPDRAREIVALVDGLLEDQTARPRLSLIAETGGKLVGHILFTALRLQSDQYISARILAPLAVSGDWQGEGVGGALIKEGLERLADSGVELVFVLGHPGYYSKFGFQPAGILGFSFPPFSHEILAVIGRIEGKVLCPDILNQPQHWRE